jgi:hypothetical protein
MIEEMMKAITNRKDVPIFRVSLIRWDHSDGWCASAYLRGASEGGYDTTAETPELALTKLIAVLDSLTCPTCHQRVKP